MIDREFLATASGLRLIVRGHVFANITGMCIAAYPKETGGILIGRIVERDTAEIIEATSAPKDSRSTRWSFQRGTAGLQDLLNQRWQSGASYFGEWHFHPNAEATPSSRDLDQMRSIIHDPAWRCPEAFLIVCGGSPRRRVVITPFLIRPGDENISMVAMSPQAAE